MEASNPSVQSQQAALGQVVLFQAPDGQVSLDVRLDADTVWLSQAQMAELFGRDRSVINKHIGNVFKEGELAAASTCAKFAQVQMEGARVIQRQVDFYNLDVIISVGYRVKSPTQEPDDPPRDGPAGGSTRMTPITDDHLEQPRLGTPTRQ